MKKSDGDIIFSPTDLVRYLASPFASWMDRYYLENPHAIEPDAESEDERLVAQTGDQHEIAVLNALKEATEHLVEIPKDRFSDALLKTQEAIEAQSPIIYQGALQKDQFAGYTDFMMLGDAGQYQVWDTKLARAPKPYYAIQLCCYSEMLALHQGGKLPEKFGIILGNQERVEFRTEDFFHYYLYIKNSFLSMQEDFNGNFSDCPAPLPRAEHRRWTSHAEKYFLERDHLIQVAGITTGQIKKLHAAGIQSVSDLSNSTGIQIPKLALETFGKLVSQARLQCETRADRAKQPDAPPRYEILSTRGANGEPLGLAALPPYHPADVFFDMEGYPLAAGGLEYLFGASVQDNESGSFAFHDWWAHDRSSEKTAFEGFIDWVYTRWRSNPGMHIYHYAAYEVSAIRRLSTRHDTRQDQVDELLRNNVFVDLYQIVRQGLRIGEDSYSIKKVELLYRPKRSTDVATAVDSIVQYARWIESGQPTDWMRSSILKGIRDYNEDDCKSTAELLRWLRKISADRGIASSRQVTFATPATAPALSPDTTARLDTVERLRQREGEVSTTLADLIDFHRREEKPMWWRMFDRAEATPEVLRDDPGCIEGIVAMGTAATEKQSLVQRYTYSPEQECKLSAGDKTDVMFTFNLDAKLKLVELSSNEGTVALKISKKGLAEKLDGAFPQQGTLIPYEYVPAQSIQKALTEVAAKHLDGQLHTPVAALLNRTAPCPRMQNPEETVLEAAVRVTRIMSGGCLVIQGPPGTGKSYTASRVIASLLASGKRVGVGSNSHKAIVNLLEACGDAAREAGRQLIGLKVGGDLVDRLFENNPQLRHVESNGDAFAAYKGGIVGGTAWLFTRPEWEGTLDFLFIDEAGQVSLANAVAMARCAQNLVLLGDQMQLEQPVQGSHPGDAGLSVLQYALKDTATSRPDAPEFHAVVPHEYGLFLGESRRMHPSVCRFISDSIYEGRLSSFEDCSRQAISILPDASCISQGNGIVFSAVEHDGNIQQSDEEVRRVLAIYEELAGRPYADKDGVARPLALEDFLFIAPYNAQVRALQATLPAGARVGSVDKFQGQEAPVCILSLCSSYGEYGSRGLGFILDRNRINVAISRAQCLAIVVADPRIATTAPGSLAEMSLLNLFCKIANPRVR